MLLQDFLVSVLCLHRILEPEKTLELFVFQMKKQTTGKMRRLAQGHSASSSRAEVTLYSTPRFMLPSKLASENEELTSFSG